MTMYLPVRSKVAKEPLSLCARKRLPDLLGKGTKRVDYQPPIEAAKLGCFGLPADPSEEAMCCGRKAVKTTDRRARSGQPVSFRQQPMARENVNRALEAACACRDRHIHTRET